MELQLTRPSVVTPVKPDPQGIVGPTPGKARGKAWRRTSPGMFVPAQTPWDTPEQRIVEAVAGAHDGMAATGWAALHWQGAQWFEGRTNAGELLPVPIALGDQQVLSPRPGVQFCHDWLFDDDVITADGLPITRPERSVCVAAVRARSLEATVQVIDMAASADLIDLETLAAYAERLRGRPHTRRLFSAIALAEENVWSPMEVHLRFRWLACRDTELLCNAPIFTREGTHLFTPDLFDPAAGVFGEYDGVVHDESRVRRRDLEREELARAYGLERVAMISTDLRSGGFEQRLSSAYGRAARRTTAPRWTLEQPEWWVDTSTVALRQALSTRDQERGLRHGAA